MHFRKGSAAPTCDVVDTSAIAARSEVELISKIGATGHEQTFAPFSERLVSTDQRTRAPTLAAKRVPEPTRSQFVAHERHRPRLPWFIVKSRPGYIGGVIPY